MPTPPATKARTYCELDDGTRQALDAARVVDDDEYWTLWCVNLGRRFAKMRLEDSGEEDPVYMESAPVGGDGDGWQYYDAITCLLFAAHQEGLDSRRMCLEALSLFDSFSSRAVEFAEARVP